MLSKSLQRCLPFGRFISFWPVWGRVTQEKNQNWLLRTVCLPVLLLGDGLSGSRRNPAVSTPDDADVDVATRDVGQTLMDRWPRFGSVMFHRDILVAQHPHSLRNSGAAGLKVAERR